MQEAFNKVNDCVINIVQQSVADALETCNVDHNKAFIEGALESAMNGFSLFILGDSWNIRNSSEDTILSSFYRTNVARDNYFRGFKRYCSHGIYGLKFGQECETQYEKSVKDLVCTPPATMSSSLNSSFGEARKSGKNRRSKEKSSSRKSSVNLSNWKMWSPKGSMKDAAMSSELFITSSEAETEPFELEMLHATDIHFWNMINYNVYRLLVTSGTYNREKSARMGNYARRTETVM